MSDVSESARAPAFEFQKWPVYDKALIVVQYCHRLCEALPRESATGLRDQLRRASQSIPLNIAEGCSRYGRKEKANFWRIAKGSVFECVAIIDVVGKLALTDSDTSAMYGELETVGRMLTGLIKYVESGKQKPRLKPSKRSA